MSRNYASISPSALSLLKMKGHTALPFAKEASELLERHGVATLPEGTNDNLYYWMRIFHFESRYASINQLLNEIQPANVLEISSGYSFRGLDYCMHRDAHYIDTDLPDVIELKKSLQEDMLPCGTTMKGKLETIALNALDEDAFAAVVSRFEGQPFTIVNEGLLMYLTEEEKIKLCSIIHKHLAANGGSWITADVYIRSEETSVRNLKMSREEQVFFSRHRIDENKFESEAAAEQFFKDQGFVVVKEARVDPFTLSSIDQLIAHVPEEVKRENKPMPKIQSTWLLSVA